METRDFNQRTSPIKKLSPVYPMDGHVHWNIFTNLPKSKGDNMLVCSLRYSKHSTHSTDQSVVCDIRFNQHYGQKTPQPELAMAFKQNLFALTQIVKSDHQDCKEILICNEKEAPNKFLQETLKDFATENGLAVKVKTPHFIQQEKDRMTGKSIRREITVVALALQL